MKQILTVVRPLLVFALVGCSATYLVSASDVERLRQGAQVAQVKDAQGRSVDLATHQVDYVLEGAPRPQRVSGIEALNQMISDQRLTQLTHMKLTPTPNDQLWPRVGLGGGVGFVAGLVIGYAVTNRIALERLAHNPQCSGCSIGTVLVGAFTAAVLGAAGGGGLAYFASGIGNTEPATVEFLPPDEHPTSTPSTSTP